MIDLPTLAALGVASFLAGVMDAIVGGGGLIVLPALLIGLPSTPVATVLGTSKMTSIFGTGTAAATYIRYHRPQYKYAVPMTALALVAAAVGAFVATQVSGARLKPVVLVALTSVWLFTWFRKDFGHSDKGEPGHRRALTVALAGGSVIGFYDGLIGPGTGSFLLFLLIAAEGATFLRAASTAKLVNTATNVGAIIVFAASGHVLFTLGLCLAICNVAGSRVGSKLAIRKGSQFVRHVFLIVVAMLIVRLAYDVV